MNRTEKTALLSLLLALLLCLTACSGGETKANGNTEGDSVTASEVAAEEETAASEEEAAPAEETAPAEEVAPAVEETAPAEEVAPAEEDAGEEVAPAEAAAPESEDTAPPEASESEVYGLEANEPPEEELEPQMLTQGITEEEYATFGVTVAGAKIGGFRDFSETMNSSFLGTWYDPSCGEALRLTEEGAYVYIPYLGCWGETLCRWTLTDRSDRGKVPELDIYCFGEDGPPLAYYVAGNTGEYFWCVSQGQLFYRQD